MGIPCFKPEILALATLKRMGRKRIQIWQHDLQITLSASVLMELKGHVIEV